MSSFNGGGSLRRHDGHFGISENRDFENIYATRTPYFMMSLTRCCCCCCLVGA